jgi:hypothetical protein
LQLIPDSIPEAWENGQTTALALEAALSRRHGKALPWATTRDAIGAAFQGRYLEQTADSGPWPCDFAGAQYVRIALPSGSPPTPPPGSGILVGEAELTAPQIQDLAEEIGAIIRAAAGFNLRFRLRLELDDARNRPAENILTEINRHLAKIAPNLKLK